MTKRFVLTFDIDWAPDYAILKVWPWRVLGIKPPSLLYDQEIINRGHNLGSHPNFLEGSSHGSSVEEIVNKCFTYAPNAWCMRTHCLVQSTPLLHKIFSNFPQLKLDVSLLMHRSPFAHKVTWNFYGTSFDRLLYNWEDDAQFSSYEDNTIPELFFGELTVFDFHPITIPQFNGR